MPESPSAASADAKEGDPGVCKGAVSGRVGVSNGNDCGSSRPAGDGCATTSVVSVSCVDGMDASNEAQQE